jgi:hypothetical protein
MVVWVGVNAAAWGSVFGQDLHGHVDSIVLFEPFETGESVLGEGPEAAHVQLVELERCLLMDRC